MIQLRRFRGALAAVAFVGLLALPALALAGPRSGGSFGGRGGFRSGGGFSSRSSGGYSRGYRGGPNVIVTPGFGWGWGFGPFGWGGGFGLFGTLFTVAVVGAAAVAVAHAVRRAQRAQHGDWEHGDDGEVVAMPGRAWVYTVQIGLGRSGRAIR
jgi:uncharacterized membrane protein